MIITSQSFLQMMSLLTKRYSQLVDSLNSRRISFLALKSEGLRLLAKFKSLLIRSIGLVPFSTLQFPFRQQKLQIHCLHTLVIFHMLEFQLQ